MVSTHSIMATALACLAFSVAPVTATTYSMVKEYYGSTFFDEWTFYNNYDNLTNGDVVYVSAQNATTDQLAYVDTSTNHAIIKVDNTSTVVWDNKRNSVRISSDDTFGVGSLWVADIYHAPYGCSVWPAWWSQAAVWPQGGEIDTFEGINTNTQNQMSLHTETGCTAISQNQTSTLVASTNCSYAANEDQGCIVTDPSTGSYGAGFASSGGGAFVTEMASTGINIWFFARSAIPSSLSSNASSIDTSAFGTPVGNWPSTGCNITEFFEPQNLIFDITLCGDWADGASWNSTCSGICYNNWVMGNGTDYDNAYFEVGYVRVFSTEGTNTVVSPTTTGSGSSSTTSGSSSQSSSSAGLPYGGYWMSATLLVVVGLFGALFTLP
ncbi:glycoside hydrolase family 16 protein [Suillus tomentosus]|nr:glycoside hydrolase family 16 protein [Suillus tomentosus]